MGLARGRETRLHGGPTALDLLALWQEAGWGWAMWNLRGAFGVVDSGRDDVKYDSFRGHKLDRELLELIRAH